VGKREETNRLSRRPAYWIINERRENWEVDKSIGFSLFGLPEYKRAMAGQLFPGDILLTYVSSGISAFADARRVEANKGGRLRLGEPYDTPFPISIRTSPLVALTRDQWIKIHELVRLLSFTKGKKDWRQSFRFSLRHICRRDGELIFSRLKKVAASASKVTDRGHRGKGRM